MRIAAISDIHGKLPERAPACDIIIIAGDICPDLRPIEAQGDWLDTTFRRWLEDQPIPVYATWGNHDLCGERGLYPPDLPWFLGNLEGVELLGKKLFFSPYTPRLPHWAFSNPGDDIPQFIVDKIEQCDILVTHAPVYGYVDYLRGAGHLGCKNLHARCEEIQPELIICGHIHEAFGEIRTGWAGRAINVASLDGHYKERKERWTLIES